MGTNTNMLKKSARKVRRKIVKKELEHTPEFEIKPRTVFIAGAIILLVVLTFALSQTKTNQTAFVVKQTSPKMVESVSEGSIKNLQETNTEFGKVCKYELFKSGEWTSGHSSILSCSELAKQNIVVQ